MRKISLALVVLAVSLMLPAIGAEAGILMDGSTTYHAPNFNAKVYWKVYSPLDAGSPLTSISDYAYYYQFDNIGTGGDNDLTQLGVDNPFGIPITGGGYLTTHNLGSLTGTVAPGLATYGLSGSSAVWTFTGIGKGSSSYLLYYKSTAPPTFVTGGVQAGANNKEDSVPGPAAEPISMVMFGLGLVGLGGRAVRKRFKA